MRIFVATNKYVEPLKAPKAMKRTMLTLIGLALAFTSASALSYEESRDRAWYLTDKMAYELNLTQEQYDRAYEINLNYFLNVNYAADIDGPYWRYRNQDLGYVLFDWQYSRYAGIPYFYRPLVWRSGVCIMVTYDYYDRGFYYFNRPAIYNVYRGVSWRHRPRVNPYRRMTFSANGGMRDRYGDFGHGYYMRDGRLFDAPRPERGDRYGHRGWSNDSRRDNFESGRERRPYSFGNNSGGRNSVRGGGGNYRDKIEGGNGNNQGVNREQPSGESQGGQFKNRIQRQDGGGSTPAAPSRNDGDNSKYVLNGGSSSTVNSARFGATAGGRSGNRSGNVSGSGSSNRGFPSRGTATAGQPRTEPSRRTGTPANVSRSSAPTSSRSSGGVSQRGSSPSQPASSGSKTRTRSFGGR